MGHSTSVVLRLFSTFEPLNCAYYIENDIYPFFKSFLTRRHFNLQLHKKKVWKYPFFYSHQDLKVASVVLRARIWFFIFLSLNLDSCPAFIITTNLFTYMGRKWIVSKKNYSQRSCYEICQRYDTFKTSVVLRQWCYILSVF